MKLKNLVFFIALGLAFTACTKKQDETPSAAAQATPAPLSTASPAVAATPGASATVVPGATPASDAPKTIDMTVDSNGLTKAVVVVKTNKGTIKFKLYANDAPVSAKRFVELAQSKFYDGLSFHRVVPGFVVQAGDPKSRNKSDPAVGTGGSGLRLKAEFNSRKHVRGTVALARSQDRDSADSQFYFSMGSFPHLDNAYTVIGQVVDYGEKVGGKDVLDRIRQWDDIVEMHVE